MKTRLIAQKAQMNNNSLPQGEIVNRVMGIKEWGLLVILSIFGVIHRATMEFVTRHNVFNGSFWTCGC